MLVRTSVGTYEIITNHKDAFNKIKFEARYVDASFDKFTYLVGDISANILRLKGFSDDEKSIHSYNKIPDYIAESINPGSQFYVLKRIVDNDAGNER